MVPPQLHPIGVANNPLRIGPGDSICGDLYGAVAWQISFSFAFCRNGVSHGHCHNDLNHEVIDLLNRSIADADGTIYAFGSAFADLSGVNGIHDIHITREIRSAITITIMACGRMARCVNLPAQNTWIAVFIEFQTQNWQTDDNGNPFQAALAALA